MRKLEGCDKVMYSSNAIRQLGADARHRSVEEFAIPPFMTLHQEGREYLTRAPVDPEISELREQCSELTVEISRVRSEFYESMNKLHEEKQKNSKLEQKYNSVSQKLQEEEEKTLNFNTRLIAARRTINDMKERETEQSKQIKQLLDDIVKLNKQIKNEPERDFLNRSETKSTTKRQRERQEEEEEYVPPRNLRAVWTPSDRLLRRQTEHPTPRPPMYWVAYY